MNNLRSVSRERAENRVEKLRKELHVYGFLEEEPDLTDLGEKLHLITEDPLLTELFRLGGGLKTEFQLICNELQHEEIVYDDFLDTIYDRLFLISSSFNVKSILEERGRLQQLERVRNYIVKLRNVPRAEVPNVARSLIPMLSELLEIDTIPIILKKTVNDCITEMTNEIQRIDLAIQNQITLQARTAVRRDSISSANTSSSTSLFSNTSQSVSAGTLKGVKTRLGPISRAGTGVLKNTIGIKGGKSTKLRDDSSLNIYSDIYIDSLEVRTWSQILGVVYFGSNLPDLVQKICLNGLEQLKQKKKCNQIIDNLIKIKSEKILNRMDLKYKKTVDAITSFLENQENFHSFCINNVTDYFLRLAVLVENHRTLQKNCNEKNEDDIWDLNENFRVENEEKEILLLNLLENLKSSGEENELKNNFDKILSSLHDIENSYRLYHDKSCFARDRHPLYIIDEFKTYLLKISCFFNMTPKSDHQLLFCYDDIYDEILRLNKKYFDEDPCAGGVKPRERKDSMHIMPKIKLKTNNTIVTPVPLSRKQSAKNLKRNSVSPKNVEKVEKDKKNSLSPASTDKKNNNNNNNTFNSIIPILLEVEKEEEEEKDEIFYDSLNIIKIKNIFELKEQNKLLKNNSRKFFLDESEKKTETEIISPPKCYSGSYKILEALTESVQKLVQDPVIIPEMIIEETVAVTVTEIVSRPGTGENLIPDRSLSIPKSYYIMSDESVFFISVLPLFSTLFSFSFFVLSLLLLFFKF